MSELHFWNGNKSASRQEFELALLGAILAETELKDTLIRDDRTDYPDAKDEGEIFQRGIDVCVTVAGNPKFTEGDFIPVHEPLMNGLLGHRLIIIRQEDADTFSNIKTAQDLKSKTIGIPATWADASLFRDNGYPVHENGSLDDIFQRLANGDFDYVALGANEIEDIFVQFAKQIGSLVIEQSIRLYYPFALVFYVHPNNRSLADSIRDGLATMHASGDYQQLFSQFNGVVIANCSLASRHEIQLQNHALPNVLQPRMLKAHSQILNY